ARRTNWTARLTLALPALLFLLLTICVWTGIEKAGGSLWPKDEKRLSEISKMLPQERPAALAKECSTGPTLCYVPIYWRDRIATRAGIGADRTLFFAGISSLPLLLIATTLATLIAVWALWPSAVSEAAPPRGSGHKLKKDAQIMGEWLTEGY